MENYIITLDRSSRLAFDGRHRLTDKEWYSQDEFYSAGHVPWDLPPKWARSQYTQCNIGAIFKRLCSVDAIYALSERLDRPGIDGSLEAAKAILRMNVRFDRWTSGRGYGPDEGSDYEWVFFFFRKQEDAVMFQMLWG